MTLTRLAGAAFLLTLVAACGPTPASAPPPAVPTSAPTPVAGPPITPVPPFDPPAGIVVTRVVDGDTLELADGRTIRVLGIDSCEASTPAGPAATAQARRLVEGRPATLGVEPGVDTDRYDRLLRYVGMGDGRDFGTVMVAGAHTAVYAGSNDASDAYVARLRAADPNGRTCGDEEPATTTSEAPPAVEDGDDDSNRNRSGSDSGSSSGSGGGRVGRDGDGDGLCNESTVPVPC